MTGIGLTTCGASLMPLPGLDGGQLTMLLIETLMRRPPGARAWQLFNMAGMMLIIGLSIVVTWHDTVHLVS